MNKLQQLLKIKYRCKYFYKYVKNSPCDNFVEYLKKYKEG